MSVLQCVAVCCSVLQCVAVSCSVLQCVAACCSLSIERDDAVNANESHSMIQLRLSCMSHISQHTSIHSHCIHNETRLVYVCLTAYQHCDCHAWVTSYSRPLSTLIVFTVRQSEILSCECSECNWVSQYISMEIYCETMPMNLTYIVHTSWQWRCIECEWVMNCANELWQWRSMHYDKAMHYDIDYDDALWHRCIMTIPCMRMRYDDNDDALNANEWVSRCIECEWMSIYFHI